MSNIIEERLRQYPDANTHDILGVSSADQMRLLANKARVESPFTYFEMLHSPVLSNGKYRYATHEERKIVEARIEKLKQEKPEWKQFGILYALKGVDGSFKVQLYCMPVAIKFNEQEEIK